HIVQLRLDPASRSSHRRKNSRRHWSGPLRAQYRCRNRELRAGRPDRGSGRALRRDDCQTQSELGARRAGRAEDLPFSTRSFDAALAVLTIHHWRDWRQGLSEMRRVANRQMILLFEPAMIHRFWVLDNSRPTSEPEAQPALKPSCAQENGTAISD